MVVMIMGKLIVYCVKRRWCGILDIQNMTKNNTSKEKVSKRFKKGGYFKSEEVEPGVTIMEMDSKGFMETFGKYLFNEK